MLAALLLSDVGNDVLVLLSPHDVVQLRQVCRDVRRTVLRHIATLRVLTLCARIHPRPLSDLCSVPSALHVPRATSILEVLLSLGLPSLERLTLHCTPANLAHPRGAETPPPTPPTTPASQAVAPLPLSPSLGPLWPAHLALPPAATPPATPPAEADSPFSTPTLGRRSPVGTSHSAASSPGPQRHLSTGGPLGRLPSLRSLVLVLGAAGGRATARPAHVPDSTVVPLLLHAVSGTLSHLEISPTSVSIPSHWLAASVPPMPCVRSLALHRLQALPAAHEAAEFLARFPSLSSLELEQHTGSADVRDHGDHQGDGEGDGEGDDGAALEFEARWEACREFGTTLLQALHDTREAFRLTELRVAFALIDVARLVASLPHLTRLVWTPPDILDEVWLTDPDAAGHDDPRPVSPLRFLEISCSNALLLSPTIGAQLARVAPRVQFLSLRGVRLDGLGDNPNPVPFGAHLQPLLSALDGLPRLAQLELGVHWPARCEDEHHARRLVGLFSNPGAVEELTLLVAWDDDGEGVRDDDGDADEHMDDARDLERQRLVGLVEAGLSQFRQLRTVVVESWAP